MNFDYVIGLFVGLALGLIIFLGRQDFLQQQCDRGLVKENMKRNFVCKVRLSATIVDLNNT